MKNLICKITGFTLTVLLTSMLCIFLYKFNNKYTKESIQPSQGTITLSQTDLKEPIYLINDWAFYPERLLTPENFSNDTPLCHPFSISIGDITQFINYDNFKNPHGCGTYVMHISLPDTPAIYALDLPEIFSSYRLYLNDTLFLQMGNPDPQNYASCTQNRTVIFEADKQVTILLAVSDYSHFYSGIVYPPALGTPETIASLQKMRLGISVSILTFGLLIAVLSLYFGIRMKNKNALLFFLLCISMCIFSSYYIIHTVFAFGIFPIYAIELASGYLLIFLTVLLHNRLCRSNRTLTIISCGITAFFCAASLLYGLCSAHLTTDMIRLFSTSIFALKTSVAAYLLLTSWFFFNQKTSGGMPLLLASISYGIFFIWDRILPNYEPIYGGWFTEWGSFILVMTIGYILWHDMVSAYLYGLIFAEEHHQILRQLSIQNSYMQKLSTQISENRKIVHDFRQHLYTISTLVDKLSAEKERETIQRKLSDYLHTLSAQQTSTIPKNYISFSKNIAVDALLSHYYTAATANEISAIFQLTLPDTLPLSDAELCTIFGNLLENALHACFHDPISDRRILLSSRETKSKLFLCIENTYDGKIKKKGSHFLSLHASTERFGIGLESVKEIVERHGGTMNIYPMELIFRVGIVLPY